MADPTCRVAPVKLTPADASAFRQVLGCFPTGVAVVTTRLRDVAYGITVNAFSALSLRPPLVLCCVRRGSRFLHGLAQTRTFAVNVLADHQMEIASAFANATRSDADTRWFGQWQSELGSPLIEGAAAWVDCRLERVHDGGDHVICVGRVEGLAADETRKSLVFDRGQFREVGYAWYLPTELGGLCWPVA